MEFKKVLARSQIHPGSQVIVEVEGREIVLFDLNGRYYALSNVCLHEEGPVGKGEVEGCTVTCPWHQWEYDIPTGACLGQPGLKLKTYEVKVEGEDILIGMGP